MTIETSDGVTVITGSDIERYRLLVLIKAMELEVKTGMKMSRNQNTYQAAQYWGVNERNKQKRLDALTALYNEMRNEA